MEVKKDIHLVDVTINGRIPKEMFDEIAELQQAYELTDEFWLTEGSRLLITSMKRRIGMAKSKASKNSRPKKRGPYKKKQKGEAK